MGFRGFAVIFCLLIFANPVWAGGLEGTYTIIIKKQQKKKLKRWSLAEWLATKNRMRLMDEWLALHSSDTNWEAFFGGGYAQYDSQIGSSAKQTGVNMAGGHLGYYYKIFGVEGSYLNSSDENRSGLNASIHLRLLGTGIQNSNITLSYGFRDRKEPLAGIDDEAKNQYAGASIQLYILSFFGLKGDYRHFFKANTSNGIALDGHRTEATAFFEFSFMRLSLSWFDEPLTLSSPASPTIKRNGYLAGLDFFF